MASTPPTIVSLKQSFLTTQTRLLSQPLAPTRAWSSHNSNNIPDNNALPEKAIDDALFKLNHRLHQHSRRVYAPQATRHVAEQIDQLYWNAAEAATSHTLNDNGDEPTDGEGLTLGADLADPAIIATLPLEWDSSSSSSSSSSAESPLDAKRYAELAGELHALAARKTQAAARVARLRRMRALLEPFGGGPAPPAGSGESDHGGDVDDGNLDKDGGGGGGGSGVQENLVTRNGEVEAELQRMRMLLARVGGRVGMLKEQGRMGGGGDEDSTAGSLFSEPGGEDVGMDEQRKVGMLLERF
ncbi:hypothetical protein NEMBOFW57_004994 [Staphylotrichum longicolle]|uniref:Kinetochore protein fta4 n=1 Tax=Staphylotrichum longicolle TaxID=669026 RepID=A0AAD4EWH7_9PEZI|nr:hypothetical protein NEMBOFW57_004994 [Staphylotrichum longicolle]